jgi:hypothetical protein
VVLERAIDLLASVADVPLPSRPDQQIELTVVDVGWELGHVLATTSWTAEQIRTAGAVVVVTCVTIPGLRHLESTLGRLGQIPTVGAVVGPSRRHWPKEVQRSFGALTRDLDRRGRLIVIPRDPRLELAGIDSSPLPSPLLEAARSILKLTIPAKRDEQ